MSSTRIPQSGQRLDRSHEISFQFNGRSYRGFAGDTLASALLAAGERVLAHSWKYHRPRGIISCGVEEPSALVQLEQGPHSTPNAKMPEVELYEALSAQCINPWPGAGKRLFSINRWFTPLFPAGFYYKTFMWPTKAWMFYERFIRKAGGLGAAPTEADADRYVHQNIHCDVLIAGGGVAGLAAALAAARSGARVILAELGPCLGGSAHRVRGTIHGKTATDWVTDAEAELGQMPQVRVIRRGVVFGYYDHNFLTIREALTDHLPLSERNGFRERLWRVRAAQVVLATGAHERPMVFGNNDLPGVMLSSAMADYLLLYGVLVGRNIVLLTNNDSAYGDALVLHGAGAKVTVVDVREDNSVANGLVQQAHDAGIAVLRGCVPIQACGGVSVRGITVRKTIDEKAQGEQIDLTCDAIGMAGGWNPAVHLYSHSGGKTRWNQAQVCFVPGVAMPGQFNVGACNANWSLAQTLVEASRAGASAAKQSGFDAAAEPAFYVNEPAFEPIQAFWIAETGESVSRRSKAFVDYQNDVGASDIELAIREGFESIEHIKRFTAMGFGTEQGKLGNINGLALAARALGKSIEQVGTTTFRPNYLPITFGTLAGLERGDLFDPARKTSPHECHVAAGALFEDVGQWKRPWYFPKGSEDLHQAVQREVLAVRNGVAIMDASTLGKIDIQGPDAAKLLNWVYTNPWFKLEVGKCRYGLMLDENGMVFDDGVTARLGEQHFLMTTTTGGAARVLTWLERWVQTEWPDMKVYMTTVTDQWSTFAVVGPGSRAVVERVCNDVDLSAVAFPFMSHREGTVAGVRARIMRISFSGELSFEVNVPSNAGAFVWKALMAAGADFNITPYGTETMHVLRAEKGYIIVGQDTDGSISPIDLGMGAMVAKNKDFLGRRSLSRSDTAGVDRKQLVGLLTEDPQTVLPEGGQLTERSQAGELPVPMLGHVTSSYFSPTLKRSIAMAVVRSGTQRMGQKVFAALADGRYVGATVCSPVFYDPEGTRHNV
ncbi:MAG: sarcosine oxidase subunit alpha family protein [Comamonadaceae bacterium]|nr:MAG: sarcosine oxidase subunit alpha family protein [Comamonadaceae bacterium]